jgi:hypothetical protein
MQLLAAAGVNISHNSCIKSFARQLAARCQARLGSAGSSCAGICMKPPLMLRQRVWQRLHNLSCHAAHQLHVVWQQLRWWLHNASSSKMSIIPGMSAATPALVAHTVLDT